LLEERLMQYFGFSREEGLAVAIYAHEHMQSIHGETGVDFFLPRSTADTPIAFDIWDVVDGHLRAYQEIGRPEWAARVQRYVLTNRERIIQVYQNSIVPWATAEDTQRATAYLTKLEAEPL
jgi:hypothetical protein